MNASKLAYKITIFFVSMGLVYERKELLLRRSPDVILLTLSDLQANFDASAADDYWKHCDKMRNCSQWAIFLLLPCLQNSSTAEASDEWEREG